MKVDVLRFDPAAFWENPQLSGLLFYGSEGGLKDFFIASLLAFGRLTSLSEGAFLEEAARYLTPDLFMAPGEKRLICIEDVTDKNSKAFEAILSAAPQAKLVLYGAALKTTSKLVQFAAKSPFVQAMGCYPLELPQMTSLLKKAGHQANMTFTPEALKALALLVTPATLTQNLMKLSLYKGQTPACIELADVEACLGEAADLSLEMAYALSARRPDLAAALLSKAGDIWEPIPLIRQVLRHFMMLLQVRCALDNKIPLPEALLLLSPPLFFKKAPLFQAHAQTWSLDQLYRALSLLEQAESAVKQSSLTLAAVPSLLVRVARISHALDNM